MKKTVEILNKIFGWGMLFVLFAGGLSFVGYVAAMIIGGETAVTLCEFIFNTYLPWIIRLTAVFTGIGIVGMYLGNKKALAIDDQK